MRVTGGVVGREHNAIREHSTEPSPVSAPNNGGKGRALAYCLADSVATAAIRDRTWSFS